MKSIKMTYVSSIGLTVIFIGAVLFGYGFNAEISELQAVGGYTMTIGFLPFLVSTFRSVSKQEKARKLRRKQDKLDYLARKAGK